MPLPECIEIVPLSEAPVAEIAVPGSKSVTNRALALAALADGTVELKGALWSDDTQAMVEALRRLGFSVKVETDPAEEANRSITVEGRGGAIPRGGDASTPLDLDVGNAGTAARFLAALVCLGRGLYRLDGTPRMRERPQGGLFQALRRLGYTVESANDRLPAVIHGSGPRPGRCHVEIADSSQFASALILASGHGGWQIDVSESGDIDEQPYVAMTRRLVGQFPSRGGVWNVEPDASSGSYFWAAGWLLSGGVKAAENHRLPVRVRDWPVSGWQVDARFPGYLPLPSRVSREGDLGDSIMTAMTVAADSEAGSANGAAAREILFTDLRRLRLQECERVAAMRVELSKCGARIQESGDTLLIRPSALHGGALIETYGDHRIAMCLATLGLKLPGLRIHNPACVQKTFPNFFQKLAAPPPGGLGATLWAVDPASGERRSRVDFSNPEQPRR